MDAAQVLGMVVVAIGCMSFAAARECDSWERKTVERGLALYDPVTGKWRWREPTDTPAGGEGRE